MLASLLMAVAIPEAFGDRALLFAGVVRRDPGRAAPVPHLRRRRRRGTIERERAARILIWFSAAGVFWIAGALADGHGAHRALAGRARDRLRRAARRSTGCRAGRTLGDETWDVETAHFAERFQLFIIIALGESIVITGATTAELDLDAARAVGVRARVPRHGGAVVAVLQLRRARSRSAGSSWRRTGRCSRATATRTSTSCSSPGIIVGAVGDELVIAHPTDVLPTAEVVVVVAGPAIYLLGHVLFRLGWRAR